jgi:hypothetical protein
MLTRRGLFGLLVGAALAPIIEPVVRKTYVLAPLGGWRNANAVRMRNGVWVLDKNVGIDIEGFGGIPGQLAELQGTDAKAMIKSLKLIKGAAISLYCKAAFNNPQVARNLAQVIKHLDHSLLNESPAKNERKYSR